MSKAFREMIKEWVQGGQVLGLLTMGLRNIYSKKDDQASTTSRA